MAQQTNEGQSSPQIDRFILTGAIDDTTQVPTPAVLYQGLQVAPLIIVGTNYRAFAFRKVTRALYLKRLTVRALTQVDGIAGGSGLVFTINQSATPFNTVSATLARCEFNNSTNVANDVEWTGSILISPTVYLTLAISPLIAAQGYLLGPITWAELETETA